MSELTSRIKTKYPQYQNIPDQELETKVLAKYPQYKLLATPQKRDWISPQFAGNVVKSGARLIGDTASAVFHPIRTAKSIGGLVAGTAQLLDPTQKLGTQHEDTARAVGQFYKDRYGGLENIKNTLYNDPIGALADVATVATGVGGALRGGASVASKLGSVSKASKLAQAGKLASNIGTKIDPIMIAGQGVDKVASKVASKVKPALFSRAEKITTAGIGNPAQQAKAAQKGGRSVASFIDEYNLYDRSPETAGQVVKDIGEKFDALAMSAKKNIRVGQIVKSFDDEIAKLSQGAGGVVADATRQKIAELQRRKQMFLDSVVTNNSLPLQVPLKQTTEFRRNVIDPDVPKSEFGLNPRDVGKAGGVKTARNIFRRESIKVAPELEKLGLDYGMAKELEDIVKKSEIRKSNRQLFNFTKMGGGGLGGLAAGAPGVAVGFMIEQIVNNPTFIKLASKGLKRALQAKLPQNRVTNAIGKTAGGLYQTGRFGRLIGNQTQPRLANTQIPLDLQSKNPQTYQNYTPESDLLDQIARKQGLDVEKMRQKRLNFQRR